MQTMELAKKVQHRQLMLKVSHGLSDADLDDLKYMCGDIVGEAALEDVKSAVDLFTLLQYHGYLGPSCYNFLSKGLSSIGRNDLASMLPEEDVLVESYAGHCAGLPRSDCMLQHRMMLVAVADRMRREDIIKLLFVASGKVKVHDAGARVTDDAIGALQVLAGLEESSLLCCSGYSNLCDLLQQIGRSDLADLVVGFPRSVPKGFSMPSQALGLMIEVLRNKRKVYVYHQEKLGQMKEGNLEVIEEVHSVLLRICKQGLSARNPDNSCKTSTVKSLQHAFNSQYQFLQCIFSESSDGPLKHMESFDFVNDAFGRAGNHKTVESHACPVAESAHQTRRFILEISCEIVGKEKATKVHQLNEKIENGINICSGYGKHVSSLLSSMASLLSSASEKDIASEGYRTELMNIFLRHKNYLMGTFPLLAPHIQSIECLEDLSKIPLTELTQLITSPANLDSTLKGLVPMVTVPSYAILLNLLCSSCGYVNSKEVLQNLVDYLHLPGHIAGAKEFVEKCAAALYNHVANFRQGIMDLDELCAPLITQLINPNRKLL